MLILLMLNYKAYFQSWSSRVHPSIQNSYDNTATITIRKPAQEPLCASLALRN